MPKGKLKITHTFIVEVDTDDYDGDAETLAEAAAIELESLESGDQSLDDLYESAVINSTSAEVINE